MTTDPMKKLVLINSYGPMASSLLAGLIEKLGFANYTLRRLDLNRYLLGDLKLDSGRMQHTLNDILRSQTQPLRYGGVSVLHRDASNPRRLVDYQLVADVMEKFMGSTPESVSDLFNACCTIYEKAAVFKPLLDSKKGWIELPADLIHFNGREQELVDAYNHAFSSVYWIHMHRSFRGWINALASQRIVRNKLMDRLKFNFRSKVLLHKQYESAVYKMPGLHIHFSELFEDPLALLQRIANYLEEPPFSGDLTKEHFYLWAIKVNFSKAFTPFDDQIHYLTEQTKNYYQWIYNKTNFGMGEAIVAKLLYIWSNFQWVKKCQR